MRGAKSLVYAALLRRSVAALSAVGAATSVVFVESVANADPVLEPRPRRPPQGG